MSPAANQDLRAAVTRALERCRAFEAAWGAPLADAVAHLRMALMERWNDGAPMTPALIAECLQRARTAVQAASQGYPDERLLAPVVDMLADAVAVLTSGASEALAGGHIDRAETMLRALERQCGMSPVRGAVQ